MADKLRNDKPKPKLTPDQLAVLFGMAPPPVKISAPRPAVKVVKTPVEKPKAKVKEVKVAAKPQPKAKAKPVVVAKPAPKPAPKPANEQKKPVVVKAAPPKPTPPKKAVAPVKVAKVEAKKPVAVVKPKAAAPVKPVVVEKPKAVVAAPAPKPTPAPAPAAKAKPPVAEVKLPDPAKWSHQMVDIAEQSRKLLMDFSKQQKNSAQSPLMPSSIMNAFLDVTSKMMANPSRLLEAQATLWQQYLNLWQRSTLRFLGQSEPTEAPVSDKRFKDPAWQDNPVFDYIKQSYLLTSRWLQNQVSQVEGLTKEDRKRVDFYTRQFVDALSPTNFALTNPQVLRTTLETGGENLVKGLKRLLEDLDQGRISMTDEKAFKVGENIAITPGSVVYQNRLMQLIQYAPTTKQVDKRPLIIAPPWINKYYILDLKPENSFIKWAVDQGLTVYCISWVNPDDKLTDLDFVNYMDEGILTAMSEVQKMTGEDEVNFIGYCLGGTLLASTLAYLHTKDPKRAKQITSATYFTTMVDFREAGDLSVFIDEEQLKNLEETMASTGFLDAKQMATTFNLLRANDLIWSFVVNNYLLGKQPFPFDLLYWNGDSTRMPAAMHSFYLREMYQRNNLCKAGGIKLHGVPIDLRNIKTNTFIVSTREDHIAPWDSTYAGTQLYSGKTTFCLAGSGHIAGVVNPPSANKYCHWMNDKLPSKPEEWLKGAKEFPGSWWPQWRKWMSENSGGTVPARKIPKTIEAAPGSYVKVRAV